jgi:hypothetical protein
MPRSTRARGVPVIVYRHLFDLNAGYDQVVRALAGLGESGLFGRRELRRFTALSEEARAATTSFLVSAMEAAETDEAGRLFRIRLARERREEAG